MPRLSIKWFPQKPPIGADTNDFVFKRWFQSIFQYFYGSSVRKIGNLTANTNLSQEYYYSVDASAGPVTVTLPSVVNFPYKKYFVQKVDASANAVTIVPTSPDLIGGATSVTIDEQLGSYELYSNAVNEWIKVASLGTPDVGGGAGYIQVDTYSTPGSYTWTKPDGASTVHVTVVGAGGGGGSGSSSASSQGGSGAGGGGGAKNIVLFQAGSLSATVSVQVGAGGTGGASVTNSLFGNVGVSGGLSSFGSVKAYGGGGGGSGANSQNAGGGGGGIWSAGGVGPAGGSVSTAGEGGGLGASTSNVDNEKPYGGAPGAFGTTVGILRIGPRALYGGMGGAGGGSGTDGGLTAGPYPGGNASDQWGVYSVLGGTAPGGAGGTLYGTIATNLQGAGGGGGGGVRTSSGGVGGVGGRGQQPGGGGGGGGGAYSSTQASGAGAIGGDGIVVIITESSTGTGPGPVGPPGPTGPSGSPNEAWTTLTDAATINVDADSGNKHNFVVTLGGNRTLANPTNMVDGQAFNIIVFQDNVGNRTLAYGSKWRFTGGTPTLTTTANKADVIAGLYDQALDQIIAILAKNA